MDSDLLKNVYLFTDFTPAELDHLNAVAKAHTFNPGDEVFRKGDQAAFLSSS